VCHKNRLVPNFYPLSPSSGHEEQGQCDCGGEGGVRRPLKAFLSPSPRPFSHNLVHIESLAASGEREYKELAADFAERHT
jgi:hypothetical protein